MANTAKHFTYKIQSGDTLTAIAKRKGTTVRAIMSENPSITNKNKIKAGTTLRMPFFNKDIAKAREARKKALQTLEERKNKKIKAEKDAQSVLDKEKIKNSPASLKKDIKRAAEKRKAKDRIIKGKAARDSVHARDKARPKPKKKFKMPGTNSTINFDLNKSK